MDHCYRTISTHCLPIKLSPFVADKDILTLRQQEFERVPVHILVEVTLAFALCLWGERFTRIS